MTSTTRYASPNATRWATEPLFRVEHSADFPARDWLTLDPARPGEDPDVEVTAVASPSRRTPVTVFHAGEDASSED